ncbi:MAG TPA: sugar-transfer associated ATP-grasp domain-containing protein [Miltoncostaeaceae bacterium]|nr:sugar-transfer associated ATP-grasp domain-containing protein [Miltoncostaeaceae bacterium]
MRLQRALPELAALARCVRGARRAYGVGVVSALRRAREVRRDGAWTYDEALAAGLLDPGCDAATRRALVSYSVLHAAQWRHNPLPLEPLTENKLVCDRLLTASGIPCPELFGTVGRDGGGSARTGAPVSDRAAFARFLAEDVPDEVVIKPVEGLYGLGVRIVRRLPGGRVDAGDGPVDPRTLYDDLVADARFGLFLVQERLRNHPEVAALTGSDTLQTLRLCTFVRRDGSVHILVGLVKLAVGTGPADNYRSGETGNGVADVDLADGRLGPLYVAAPSGAGFAATPVAPGTGRRVEGVRLPLFRESCALARRAAPVFLPMRTVGFDIGLTPSGPVVVEANNYWGPPLTPMPAESRALLLAT